MQRCRWTAMVAVFICVLMGFGSADAASERDSYLDGLTLVTLESEDIGRLHETRNAIHGLGGQIAIMAPPSILIGWIPSELDDAIRAQPGVRDIRREPVAPQTLGIAPATAGVAMVRFFNRAVSGELAFDPHDASAGLDGFDDRLPDVFDAPPLEYDAYLENLERAGLDVAALSDRGVLLGPPARSSAGNSDDMTGTVAVTLFFVESDGSSTDPDLYTWIPQDMQNYLDGTAAGLAWWSSEATTVVGCSVTWLINYYSGADPRCQQWVEPILHGSSYHGVWVDNVITNFGYTGGSRFTKVNAFNTWQRSYYGTDRAFSAFIPYNPPPAPTTFVGGGTAFASLGGPYSVLLYRAATPVANVFAHETGHIFWACDEYGNSGCSCSATCGEGTNGNCELCNANSRDCMMKFNDFNLCLYTKDQVGWGATSPCTPPPPPALPAPSATSLSPGDGLQGTDLTVTVTGTDFYPGAKVEFGPDVFVNTTNLIGNETLVVDVTVLNEAPLVTLDVTIRNKDGQTSTLPGAFTVLPTRKHYYSPAGGNVFPYVTPATAATALTDAITASFDGDTLFVPTMTFNSAAVSIDRGVLLHGGWNNDFTQRDLVSGKTVLDLNGNVLVFPGAQGGGLDGFIVQNGTGTSGSQPFSADFGGGIKILSATAIVANCEIRLNAATDGSGDGMGGGIFAHNSTVDIRDNAIHDNAATQGGGIYLHTCSGTVTGNTISANTVSSAVEPPEGAGIILVDCNGVTMADNTITGNSGALKGGGMRVVNSTGVAFIGGVVSVNQLSGGTSEGGGIHLDESVVTIDGTTIEANQAGLTGGGIQTWGPSSDLTLISSTVQSNTALLGAGVYVPAGVGIVNHNLVVGNTASISGGGIFFSGTASGQIIGNTVDGNGGGTGIGGIQIPDESIDMFNNIVTNSTGDGIRCGGTAFAQVSHNLSWNNSGADIADCGVPVGDINADPLFVDAPSGDYHLALNSPAIDAGNPDPAFNDPDGSRGDVGRYGSHAFVMTRPTYPKNLAAQSTGTDVTLSWSPNPEGDIASYAVYCDTVSGFVPSASNLIATVPGTDSTETFPSPADSAAYRICAVNTAGYASGYSAEVVVTVATGIAMPVLPGRYQLMQNVPNPFNPVTRITYELAERASVALDVYDVEGRRVRQLVQTRQGPGRYDVDWDGLRADGSPAASGIYFYRLRAGRFTETRKMVLLK